MITCLIVHDPRVAAVLREATATNRWFTVLEPAHNAAGLRFDRLCMVDDVGPGPEYWRTNYRAWLRNIVQTRGAPGAVLIGVPRWAMT